MGRNSRKERKDRMRERWTKERRRKETERIRNGKREKGGLKLGPWFVLYGGVNSPEKVGTHCSLSTQLFRTY
jgi:hypothetical protein